MTGEGTNRYQVLCYEQVHRLHEVMEGTVPVHGRGNFPTLDVKLKDMVQLVRSHLKKEGVTLKDMRLNGGAASYILGCENTLAYNDVDLIFRVDLGGSQSELQKCKTAVLNTILDLLPEGVNKEKMSVCSLKEAYVQKMVKVCNTHDRWSLISLNNNKGRNVELKFVDTMRRQFEFSVDSFQIILDSLLTFYEISQAPMSEHFYPTMVAESMFGNFNMALYHLNKKLIATRKPEEIRGGGLLKYCNLLVRGYQAAEDVDIKALERYMCSRFFIDFPDIAQQKIKLENYLANHFIGDEDMKYDFLMILYSVVDDSTICLMGHERRQTLNLIQQCASQALMEQDQRAYNKQLAMQQFDQQDFQTTFDQHSNLIIDQVYYGPYGGNSCFPMAPCNISVNTASVDQQQQQQPQQQQQYYQTYTTTTYVPGAYTTTTTCPLCPPYLQCS